MSNSKTVLNETPFQTAGPFLHIGCLPNAINIEGIFDTDLGVKPFANRDYNKFIKNVKRVLEEFKNEDRFVVTFMCTYNALSVTSFKDFLKDLVEIRKQYGRDCMYIDIPFLRYPEMMDVKILDKTFEEYMTNTVEYMKQMEIVELMHNSETAKLERIIEDCRS